MTTTLKRISQPPSPASVKAERERDKAQAMRDYEAEQLARLANMAQLRALRLAKERADALTTAARRPVSKKAGPEVYQHRHKPNSRHGHHLEHRFG